MRRRRSSPSHFKKRSAIEPLEPRRMLIVPVGDPLITEFMATNQGFLANEYGNTDDWIEIYNPGPDPIDLFQWYLTDQKSQLHKWQFPTHYTMPPNSYLVVFATNRDLVSPVRGEFHTNFKLGNEGEYLGLVKPDGTTVTSEYEPNYPEQLPNKSYGLTATFDDTREFDTPTPGAPNTPYFKADVFSHPHGLYDAPLQLAIDESKVIAPIRYTTDGSVPTASSYLYTGEPLFVSQTMTVRVKSFAVGAPPTVYTQTYIFPAAVRTQPALPSGFPAQWQPAVGAATPVDYEMDPQVTGTATYISRQTEIMRSLPSVAITLPVSNLFGSAAGIYSNPLQSGDAWERAASVELFSFDGADGFQVDAGVRIEGGDTRDPANTPKHSLRVRFDADYGPSELDYQVFPGSEQDEFDSLSLRAAFEDSWLDPNGAARPAALLARDQWMRDAHRAMGQPAVEGKFVHLYLNGLYWGIYNVSERIDNNFAEHRFGGRKSDYDIIDTGQLADGQINGWNAMMAIAAGGLATNAAYQSIQQYLDVPNFIDFMIVNILAGKSDLEGGDWLALRNRSINERFRFFVWDSERTLRGGADDQSNVTGTNSPAYLYQHLRANAEFRLAFADRIQKHLFADGALTPSANTARFSEIVNKLEPAMLAESARWGDYRRDVHQFSSAPYELYGTGQWNAEVERLLDVYFPERTDTVLSQFLDNALYPPIAAPNFSRPAGQISSGATLSLSSPVGQVYYTTDGTDPRAVGGSIAPTAILYQQPLTLIHDTRVRARTLVAGQWSALVDRVYYLPVPIAVTELHYHAATPLEPGVYDDNDFDFVEFTNVGSAPIDLTALQFGGAIWFGFASGSVPSLAPGERVVVVASPEAFQTRYTTAGLRIAGQYSGRLGNAAERLVLSGRFGQPIIDFTYSDQWYPITDGDGYSLVARETPGSQTLPSSPDYWRPSYFGHGNPGFKDNGHNPDDVVVSEALTHNDEDRGDWLELHNTTDHPIDIGGWYISENNNPLRKYRIAPGTILPPDGYIDYSVQENFQNPSDSGMLVPFRLDKLGETIYVTSLDGNGMLGGYRHEAAMGYGFNSTTYIRYTNSTGEVEYVPSAWRTAEKPNSPPAVAHIWDHGALFLAPVINEVMYHPPAGGDEYIELYNPHSEQVTLDRPFAPPRMIEGVFYNFAGGTTMPAQSYALIVPIDPTVFRQKYNVPAATQIFGPWNGELLNTGERVALGRAAEPDAYVPYAIADEVYYNVGPGWPAAADGQGASLNRRDPLEFGNDILNWSASLPGGTPGRPNTIAQPVSLRGTVYRDLNGNGVQEAGEQGLSGLRVFADLDGGRRYEFIDPFVVTDANGHYELNNLALGPHTLVVDRPDGAIATNPPARIINVIAGQTIAGLDFGDLGPIAGRFVFYNRSKFDANNAAANSIDDAAIATDKRALLPGQTATFANYTSYNHGINGVMIDIPMLPGAVLADDFTFRVGNTATPSQWAVLGVLPQISIRKGAGAGSSDRITLVWPDGSIRKQWLQITVKATANTGLTSPDVFYFGNAVGESGNVADSASVSITDELLARNNPRSVSNPADIINRFDYNRDGTVSVVDQLLARNNITTQSTMLRLITAPALLEASPLRASIDDVLLAELAPTILLDRRTEARPAGAIATSDQNQLSERQMKFGAGAAGVMQFESEATRWLPRRGNPKPASLGIDRLK